jgi:hypothetical protein
MTRLLCGAALFALVLGLAGCKTKKPPKSTTPETPVATVTAGDLLKEYSGNALAADGKYKGKVIQVTGKFSSVQKMVLVGYVLQLVPEDTGDLNASMIQCVLPEDAQAAAAQLQPGQKVTIQGTCQGQPIPGQVRMSECRVVQ